MTATKKAGIALDDWKLPIFRQRLEQAGYAYEDGGAPAPGVTILNVQFLDQAHLTRVVTEANAECSRTGPPKGGSNA